MASEKPVAVSRRDVVVGGLGVGIAGALPNVARAQSESLASAAPASEMINLPGRSRTCLDGRWSYIIDPYDDAAATPDVRRSFWRDERARIGGPLIEYEWAQSPVMQVPSDWNSQVPELQWYEGAVYFSRTLQATPMPGRRRFLVFEAVNYRSTVWVNGSEIGGHEGGFTPFTLEVTNALKDGANLLVVRADSRHGPETVPAAKTDWQNYGGITRSVWLVDTPAVYLRDWFVREQDGRLVADLTVDGADRAGVPVTLAVPALKLRLSGRTGPSGTVRLEARLPSTVRRWSPDAPTLYDVHLTAGADRQHDRIGLRRVETRGKQILLNGRPIFLKGISLHEEPIAPVGTRTMSDAQSRALLTEAKALGCNFVRLAHYPHSEVTTRIADELGLLVWAEVPVYWAGIAYESQKTLAVARDMLAEMIVRDRNRAAVALWSVANETPITPARGRFLRSLIADVRRLDSTRLVTAALNKNVDMGGAREGESRFVVEDELGADLDVIAVNQYEGWYGPRSPGQIADISFTSSFDKPIMFSEFGADALYGHRGPREERWTEEYQAWIYEETLKLVERTPGCVGCSPWILKDFRSPRRFHGRFQNYWNRKGLLSENGDRKLAFDVLRRYYLSKS